MCAGAFGGCELVATVSRCSFLSRIVKKPLDKLVYFYPGQNQLGITPPCRKRPCIFEQQWGTYSVREENTFLYLDREEWAGTPVWSEYVVGECRTDSEKMRKERVGCCQPPTFIPSKCRLLEDVPLSLRSFSAFDQRRRSPSQFGM